MYLAFILILFQNQIKGFFHTLREAAKSFLFYFIGQASQRERGGGVKARPQKNTFIAASLIKLGLEGREEFISKEIFRSFSNLMILVFPKCGLLIRENIYNRKGK